MNVMATYSIKSRNQKLISRFALLITAIASFALFSSSAFGQVADDARAHVVFDIDVDELRASMSKMEINLEDILYSIEPEFDKKLTSKIKRIYGAVELPNNMAEFQAITGPMFGPPPSRARDAFDEKKMPADRFDKPARERSTDRIEKADQVSSPKQQPFQPISTFSRRQPKSGHLPHHQERAEDQLAINFFIRVELMDQETTKMLSEEIKPPRAKKITIKGNDYLQAGVAGPKNILTHNPTPTSFEIGTIDFVTNADRKVLTKRCKEAWSGTPKYAVRMAGELDSLADLVKELTGMASQGAPPMAVGPLNLIPKVSALQVAVDVSQDNLLILSIEGKDEAAAEELNSVLSGLLMLGKGGFGQVKGELARDLPASAVEMMTTIVTDLELTKEGKRVSLAIAKPANFEANVKTLAAEAKVQAVKIDEANRVRQVTLAVHNYYDVHKQFPFTAREPDSTALSWRGRILPYLEHIPADTTKAHDDPANAKLVERMPPSFGDDGKNARLFFVQPETPPRGFAAVSDGTSNTIMLIQANNKTVPWLKPGDLSIDEAVEMITSLKEGESLIAGRYDGSVLTIKAGLKDEQIRPFLTHNGGEIVDWDDIDR